MDDVEPRLARIERLVAAQAGPAEPRGGALDKLSRVCGAVLECIPASAASVSMMTADQPGTVVADAGVGGGALAELQFVLGEGPCLDAFASRRPVLESQLATGGLRRWPHYSAAALARGAQAAFAFPLQFGAARLGVLDILRDRPGSLSETNLHDATTFAQVAMSSLLDGQEGAPDGGSGQMVEEVLMPQTELYQAQGMVMVMLGVTLTEAMARLRAHAFSHERSLGEVARDIVAGRLSLQRDDGQ